MEAWIWRPLISWRPLRRKSTGAIGVVVYGRRRPCVRGHEEVPTGGQVLVPAGGHGGSPVVAMWKSPLLVLRVS